MKTAFASDNSGLPQGRENINPKFEPIARLWLKHSRKPDDQAIWDTLANQIDKVLRQYLPDGASTGLLAGHQSDTRQEALCMLLVKPKYLDHNKDLSAATAAEDIHEIASQMERSVWAALKFATRRELQKVKVYNERHIPFKGIENQAAHHEIPGIEEPENMSSETRKGLLLLMLRTAAHEGLLSKNSVTAAGMILGEGLSQAEVSRLLKVSSSAVCQRMKPVKKFLSSHIRATTRRSQITRHISAHKSPRGGRKETKKGYSCICAKTIVVYKA